MKTSVVVRRLGGMKARLCVAGLVGASVLALSACAAGPELRIDAAPDQGMAVQQFVLLNTAGDDAHDLAKQSVQRALIAQGANLSDQGWTLQATLAVRPVDIGAYSDSYARSGVWDETPRIRAARRGQYLHVLSVVLSQADGGLHRAAQVSGRSDALDTPEDLLEDLSKLAVLALMEGQQAASRTLDR